MKQSDGLVIGKMIKYCKDIEKLMIQFDKDFAKYQTEISFQYSCNMCIIQIGELVGRLSEDIMNQYPDIPWHAIKAMRNLHAHDYENVDLKIVWNTLVEDIPLLENQLTEILKD